ncbi:MAG: class I SAM-dependent methyltransferase [Clostridia bacterium]|nr:class I SAM-dependent methyltransferase [Clostridia bacterium]
MNKELAELLPEGLSLTDDGNGLTLTDGELALRGDFSPMLRRVRPANLGGETLIKAARFRNLPSSEGLTAVDATAGLGEDSFLLAAYGFRVTLFEYNAVIAALLEDALKRALADAALAPIAERMTLICGDSIEGLKKLEEAPDIVLLDPMFPGRKKSGLIKKKFQLLQKLEAPCGTEEELLQAAISAGPRRIIIKRPEKGPYLAGIKPSYSVDGSTVRYDCILPPIKQK